MIALSSLALPFMIDRIANVAIMMVGTELGNAMDRRLVTILADVRHSLHLEVNPVFKETTKTPTVLLPISPCPLCLTL